MIGCQGHWSYVFNGIRNGAQVSLAAVSGGGNDMTRVKEAAQSSRGAAEMQGAFRRRITQVAVPVLKMNRIPVVREKSDFSFPLKITLCLISHPFR